MPPAFLFHSRALSHQFHVRVPLSSLHTCVCVRVSLSLHLCVWCCSLLVAVFVLLFPSRIATVNDRSHERTVKATATATSTATLAALAFWQFFALRIFQFSLRVSCKRTCFFNWMAGNQIRLRSEHTRPSIGIRIHIERRIFLNQIKFNLIKKQQKQKQQNQTHTNDKRRKEAAEVDAKEKRQKSIKKNGEELRITVLPLEQS